MLRSNSRRAGADWEGQVPLPVWARLDIASSAPHLPAALPGVSPNGRRTPHPAAPVGRPAATAAGRSAKPTTPQLLGLWGRRPVPAPVARAATVGSPRLRRRHFHDAHRSFRLCSGGIPARGLGAADVASFTCASLPLPTPSFLPRLSPRFCTSGPGQTRDVGDP